MELFVINFVKDKMTLRVPTAKITAVGMRKLAEPPIVRRALETLKGRARIKRTMWSRRAQEYEQKINSGNIVSISAVQRITETEAIKEIEAALAKGPRRGKAPDGEEPVIEDEAA